MIRINLLPHRQIKREAKQREFNLMAVFSVIAAAFSIFAGYSFINQKVDGQLERNQRLEGAIVKLDKEIADIKDLKNQIRVMLERKQVVENLQINRNQSVVVLDELSRKLPDGMYFKSIKQQGNKIVLEGIADTNARVATLVRNFNDSNWLTSPSLVEIKSVQANNVKQNVFTLDVNLKPQNTQQTDSAQTDTAKVATTH